MSEENPTPSADPDEATPEDAAPEKRAAQNAAPEAMSDDPFVNLWNDVREGWDEDKRHHALLDYAMKNERMPDLAGHYKSLTLDPDKGERAKKKLDGVVIAATHMLISMKTPARTKTPWHWNAAIIVACILIVAYVGLKVVIMRGH